MEFIELNVNTLVLKIMLQRSSIGRDDGYDARVDAIASLSVELEKRYKTSYKKVWNIAMDSTRAWAI